MRRTLWIASLCSFLIFLFLGYSYAFWVGEREKQEKAEVPVIRQKNIILPDTRIVYQYFYTSDRVTKEESEEAPEFLQGLDMEQLKSVYNGWQIILFSPETVILRCSIEGLSSETYILGEEEGFVAVFYEDAQKMIRMKERTEIPLSVLGEEDARMLREGIRITGEETLAKALADLSS
ncbi:MAG: hypothetical protein Q4C06_04125 [Bacillota bacterium]|nr:hypothetical protein [Bacillota bacterium]